MLHHYLWSEHTIFCCGVPRANLDTNLIETLEDLSKKIRRLLTQLFLWIETFPFTESVRDI
jgi:hypothetical protein